MPAFDRATIYRSAFFAVSVQWVVRAIGLINVVVLARLLQPSDFGIIAIALSAAAFVEIFGWIGLRQALVRVRDPERAHYDTAWTIQVGLFLLLSLVLIAAAPLAAAFYELPVLTPILWALSLRFLCLAFVNIGIVDFEREMDFGRDLRMRLAVRIVALATSLAAALTLRNYWALVLGLVAQSAYYTVASYIAHPYRPRLDLSRRADLLGVSLWMFFCTSCQSIQEQVERLVLGRFTTSTVVGFYSVSKDLSCIFAQEIATALNRVTFVTVAQSGAAGSSAGIGRMIGAYAIIVAPLAAGLSATAPDAVAVLLGEQWIAAAPYLQIIALYTGIQSLSLMIEAVLQARGRAERAALLSLWGLALTVFAICGAVYFLGTAIAVAWAALAAHVVMLAAGMIVVTRHAEAALSTVISNLLRPVLAAAAMGLALRGPLAVDTGSSFLDLLLSVPAGAAVYAAALALIWLASGRPTGAESEALLLLDRLRRRASAA